ncbi:hypothetical protein [Leuconostoc lactis]|uniref:hypothetical protein n=1 Tax=Leuconostoc lactis TaxID=1246 RepID=UPI0021C04679|nr:hypothetical protein [Leuconostoc lactis]MCT8387957.1 hypothetical protein [Leuconostoc lactis]
MTTLTLDAALRQQALTQLGIAQVLTLPDVTPTDLVLMAQATQDPKLLAQIQQVAESQANDYLPRYQAIQHANGFAANRGRQNFKAQLCELLPLLPEPQQLVIQKICH